jgi:hypothetical protein
MTTDDNMTKFGCAEEIHICFKPLEILILAASSFDLGHW